MVAEDRLNGAQTLAARQPKVNGPKLARAVVALAIGLLITFSAPMHENFGFTRTVVMVALIVFAAAHLYAWWSGRSGHRDPVSLILAVLSLAAAVIVPFIGSTAGFAVVLAAWALLSGLFEFLGAATRPGGRQNSTARDSIVLGALGILLALAMLLTARDIVAIIGFFGAYALIVGVFLGISAFDPAGQAAQPGDPNLETSQESAR